MGWWVYNRRKRYKRRKENGQRECFYLDDTVGLPSGVELSLVGVVFDAASDHHKPALFPALHVLHYQHNDVYEERRCYRRTQTMRVYLMREEITRQEKRDSESDKMESQTNPAWTASSTKISSRYKRVV